MDFRKCISWFFMNIPVVILMSLHKNLYSDFGIDLMPSQNQTLRKISIKHRVIQTSLLNFLSFKANQLSFAVRRVKIHQMALVSRSQNTRTMICMSRINRSYLIDIFTVLVLFTVNQTSAHEHIHTFQIIARVNYVLHHLRAIVVTVQTTIIF